MSDDHTGQPPTTIQTDGYSEPVYAERLKSSLAELAREAQIQTQRAEAAEDRLSKATRLWGEWSRRARAAESERDTLRGEVASLQLAIVEVVGELAEIHRRTTVPPPMPITREWTFGVLADGDVERLDAAVTTLTETMMPTSHAAKLAAVVRTALARHQARKAIPQLRYPTEHPRDHADLVRALRETEKAEESAVADLLAEEGTDAVH